MTSHNRCKCGSYAINHRAHGRDGSDADLCDVCYWRKRAEHISDLTAEVESLRKQRDELLTALYPFSKLLQEHHVRLPDSQPIYGIGDSLISVGDIRRAIDMYVSPNKCAEDVLEAIANAKGG